MPSKHRSVPLALLLTKIHRTPEFTKLFVEQISKSVNLFILKNFCFALSSSSVETHISKQYWDDAPVDEKILLPSSPSAPRLSR